MSKAILYLDVFGLFFLSILYSQIVNASSHNEGLIVFVGVFLLSAIIVRLPVKKSELVRPLLFSVFIIPILFFEILVSMLSMEGHDLQRAFLSMLVFVFLIFGANLFVLFLKAMEAKKFAEVISSAYIVFLMLGVVAILRLYLLQNLSFADKSMIFYSEPSHFSLFYAPVLAFMIGVSSFQGKISHTIVALALAILLQSLTLMVAVFVVYLLWFKSKEHLVMPLIVLSLAIYGLNFSESLQYFLDRIGLIGSDNLTAMSYMSGWERSIDSLIESKGFGVGFQQFGIVGEQGDIISRILAQGGQGNLYDGTALAPKVIAELGMVGVILIVIYLVKSVSVLKKLRRGDYSNCVDQFFAGTFILFSVYLFVRGVGYFSPIFFLYVSSFFWLFTKSKLSDISMAGELNNPKHSVIL